MTRHYSRRQKRKDPITNLTELANMDLNLLIKLVHRSVDIENKQQRFRTCMLARLSSIEAMLTEVLGCQLAQYWPDQPPMTDELRNKYLQEVQAKIESASQTLGLKMVRFIHEEAATQERRFDRRRKWWGWEI
jgi:phage gp36-like protein